MGPSRSGTGPENYETWYQYGTGFPGVYGIFPYVPVSIPKNNKKWVPVLISLGTRYHFPIIGRNSGLDTLCSSYIVLRHLSVNF